MDTNWLAEQFPELADFAPLVPTGQKQVFTATHRTEGPIVLKIFKPGADAERIEREMQAPLKVNSARVPRVAELGRKHTPTGEIIWLQERRIEGQSLRELLDKEESLAAAQTIRIGLYVLEVLAAAQAAGVVHRDIKPGNIIISPARQNRGPLEIPIPIPRNDLLIQKNLTLASVIL